MGNPNPDPQGTGQQAMASDDCGAPASNDSGAANSPSQIDGAPNADIAIGVDDSGLMARAVFAALGIDPSLTVNANLPSFQRLTAHDGVNAAVSGDDGGLIAKAALMGLDPNASLEASAHVASLGTVDGQLGLSVPTDVGAQVAFAADVPALALPGIEPCQTGSEPLSIDLPSLDTCSLGHIV